MPGYLPCPDYGGGNPEGSAEPICGSQDVSVIGRLPWVTLDVSTLRDGDGECLWYAVSGTYKNNPKTGLMNWDTNGQFQVYSPDGTQLCQSGGCGYFRSRRDSVRTEPLAGRHRADLRRELYGEQLSGQRHRDTSINNADVATGKFIQGTSGGSVNDQMVFITRQDIWNAIQKRTDFQPTNPK